MLNELGFMQWCSCTVLRCCQVTRLRYWGKSHTSETGQLISRPRQELDKPSPNRRHYNNSFRNVFL
jgi:hypothetical protein